MSVVQLTNVQPQAIPETKSGSCLASGWVIIWCLHGQGQSAYRTKSRLSRLLQSMGLSLISHVEGVLQCTVRIS